MSEPHHSATTGHRNKQGAVMEALIALARQRGPGIKLPTMKELALQLGVTVTTLDRCLNKLEERGIISRKQGSGIYVEDRLFQKRIGLVFGGNIFHPGASAFHFLLLEHCKKRALEHGDRFSFYLDVPGLNDAGDVMKAPVHKDLENALKSEALDGLMVVGVALEQHRWILSQGVPLVSLSTNPCAAEAIHLDYFNMIDTGIRGLLAQGCKTIGLLGVLHEHRALFNRAAASLELNLAEKWVITPTEYPDGTIHERLGRELAKQLIEQCGGRKGLPDGIVVTDDIMTSGVCAYFESAGISFPKGIKIASHANKGASVLAKWEEKLLLIEFDPQEIVATMFSSLEATMSGKPLRPGLRKIKARTR